MLVVTRLEVTWAMGPHSNITWVPNSPGIFEKCTIIWTHTLRMLISPHQVYLLSRELLLREAQWKVAHLMSIVLHTIFISLKPLYSILEQTKCLYVSWPYKQTSLDTLTGHHYHTCNCSMPSFQLRPGSHLHPLAVSRPYSGMGGCNS